MPTADGDFDLWLASRDGVHLLRNDKGRFAAATRVAPRAAESALIGGLRQRRRQRCSGSHREGVALYHGEPAGSFRDVSAESLPAGTPPSRTAAFVDADHDGDLDIMIGGRLLRNSGNGRFQDVSADARLGSTGSAVAIVPVDVDNRRDVDLLMISHVGPPLLFSNQRDGTFRDVAKEIGLPSGGPYTVPSLLATSTRTRFQTSSSAARTAQGCSR